ncbi:branched-chain amino acid ABC transporter permease [Metapseudomonas lalkuanensis]|uniref:branched-chain amino acid ABC transporter permease n=1 Tax=Metapseudomonas lalkuanensis TaxID=2604832 RepID=UPI001CF2DD98|nr:branched-chain amino acid ABC transporter permease [Pseudomonas lalkuanensis]UCO99541.1 branched-chain amino acid ABC transporter permease [Pseudomonas lalkuanensis]
MPRRRIIDLACLATFALMPLLAALLDEPFLVSLFTRLAIYGMAAASLDLLIGYGAMVSFGHAAFFGLGGYLVGIIAFHTSQGMPLWGWEGSNSALVVWPLALLCCALLGLVMGYLSLRTTGVQFIMITLAFSQMLYFILSSLSLYGGDDGILINERNRLPGLDLNDANQFYYLCVGLLVAWLLFCRRLVGSRFGFVLRGLKQSERRTVSLGLKPLRYRLTTFVIAGLGAGLAGLLWANYALFVSPDMASWQKSGELMAMVILGGVGTLLGPVLGAAVYLGLEQLLSLWTEHWLLIFGPLLLLVVLFGRQGIHGLLMAGQRPRSSPTEPAPVATTREVHP